MEAHEISDVELRRRAHGRLYEEFVRHDSMSLGLYVLPTGGVDPQLPHAEDEAYVVLRGRGRITVGEEVRDVGPGEMVIVTNEGIESLHPFAPKPRRFCIFEYVYFARPDSVVEGKDVYEVRTKIGAELARERSGVKAAIRSARGREWLRKGCKPNSVCGLAAGENHLSERSTRNPARLRGHRREPRPDSQLDLAPDGVCRAPALALGAVRFYRTFSPLPPVVRRRSEFLWHCPSARLAASLAQGRGDALLFKDLATLRTDAPPLAVTREQAAGVTWVRPEVVVEVEYAQVTADGSLRAPVFLRVRDVIPGSQDPRSMAIALTEVRLPRHRARLVHPSPDLHGPM